MSHNIIKVEIKFIPDTNQSFTKNMPQELLGTWYFK